MRVQKVRWNATVCGLTIPLRRGGLLDRKIMRSKARRKSPGAECVVGSLGSHVKNCWFLFYCFWLKCQKGPVVLPKAWGRKLLCCSSGCLSIIIFLFWKYHISRKHFLYLQGARGAPGPVFLFPCRSKFTATS